MNGIKKQNKMGAQINQTMGDQDAMMRQQEMMQQIMENQKAISETQMKMQKIQEQNAKLIKMMNDIQVANSKTRNDAADALIKRG